MVKDIIGYEGIYTIDEDGNVYSINRKKIIKQSMRGNYLYVALYKEGKRKQENVHRLVAMTFIPNPEELPCVNHKDENKLNNNVNNLEWCTAKYNNNYGRHQRERVAVLQTSIDMFSLSGQYIMSFSGIQAAARYINGSASNICACLKGRQYTSYGYIWSYHK